MRFGQKLKVLMNILNIKAVSLADILYVHPSLISRWIHGSRTLEPTSPVVERLALSVLQIASQQNTIEILCDFLVCDQTDDMCHELTKWFFDGKSVNDSSVPVFSPSSAGMCYKGMEGFKDTINTICNAAKSLSEDPMIIIYITSYQMRLMLQPETKQIWEQLCSLSKFPVSLIVEPASQASVLSGELDILTPYMRKGKIQLFYMPASNVHFCYNFTVWIRDVGLVMALEPSSPKYSFVSMFVDDVEFTSSIGITLCSFESIAKPIVKKVQNSSEVSDLMQACFDSSENLYIKSNLFSQWGLSESTLKTIAKENKVKLETIRYQINKFKKRKETLLLFLEKNHYYEIIPLDVLEDIKNGEVVTPPFFDFIKSKKTLFSNKLLSAYLDELKNLIKKYPNFHLMLTERDSSEFDEILHIKEDGIIFTQVMVDGELVTVEFDKWAFLYSVLGKIESQWENRQGITNREQLQRALNRKKERGVRE